VLQVECRNGDKLSCSLVDDSVQLADRPYKECQIR